MEVLEELSGLLESSTTAVETQVHENFLALVGGDERLLEPFRRAVES
jgi:hypothetical protein